MSDSLGEKLYHAAYHGRVSEVSYLLRDNPGFNVDWQDPDQWTALHSASFNGHVEVVKLFLAHPDINVKLKQ